MFKYCANKTINATSSTGAQNEPAIMSADCVDVFIF